MSVKLNSGYSIPLVGFGLWKLPEDTCADQVYEAIKAGYRLFDGAAIYGNEKQVGEGFARAFREGLVKRQDLFVVSKLWPTFHDPEHVPEGLERTLADLQLDYLDLYYVHFPFSMAYVDPAKRYPSDWTDEFAPGTATLESTWRALETLVEAGKVRSLGLSNYNGAVLMDLLKYARIRPAALQIEHHPYLVQPALVQFAKDSGLHVTAYSSFGPTSFVEMELPRAKDCLPLFQQPVVKKAASAHGRTPAQVLLRWSTQRKITVIPKSSSKARLQENRQVLDFDLTDDEMKSISDLDRRLRFNDPLDDNVPILVFA